jgi:hypothetical protein
MLMRARNWRASGSEAHRHGLIHNDSKSVNVLVDDAGRELATYSPNTSLFKDRPGLELAPAEPPSGGTSERNTPSPHRRRDDGKRRCAPNRSQLALRRDRRWHFGTIIFVEAVRRDSIDHALFLDAAATLSGIFFLMKVRTMWPGV